MRIVIQCYWVHNQKEIQSINVNHQHCPDDHVVYEQNFIIRNQPKNIYSIILYISCRNMVKWIARMHDYIIIVQYIQPGSLTQKYETFHPLFFTWQDSSAGAMVGKLVLP